MLHKIHYLGAKAADMCSRPCRIDIAVPRHHPCVMIANLRMAALSKKAPHPGASDRRAR